MTPGRYLAGNRGMLLAAALFVLLAVAYSFSVDLRASRGALISSDEPFYLLTRQSLPQDVGLDLTKQYEADSWRSLPQADWPERSYNFSCWGRSNDDGVSAVGLADWTTQVESGSTTGGWPRCYSLHPFHRNIPVVSGSAGPAGVPVGGNGAAEVVGHGWGLGDDRVVGAVLAGLVGGGVLPV